MNIYLIGYMASGKSKLGRDLSVLTALPFIDLDEVFEERYRIGIVDFFEKYGDPAFRQIEHTLLFETGSVHNTIIATGGGTSCSDENIQFIKSHGMSIYIRMRVEDLSERLKIVRKKRPLLMNIPVEELDAFISGQLKEREFYYMQADHIIDGRSIDFNQVVGLIKGFQGYSSS